MDDTAVMHQSAEEDVPFISRGVMFDLPPSEQWPLSDSIFSSFEARYTSSSFVNRRNLCLISAVFPFLKLLTFAVELREGDREEAMWSLLWEWLLAAESCLRSASLALCHPPSLSSLHCTKRSMWRRMENVPSFVILCMQCVCVSGGQGNAG